MRTQAHNKKPQTYLHELGSNITYGMVRNYHAIYWLAKWNCILRVLFGCMTNGNYVLYHKLKPIVVASHMNGLVIFVPQPWEN